MISRDCSMLYTGRIRFNTQQKGISLAKEPRGLLGKLYSLFLTRDPDDSLVLETFSTPTLMKQLSAVLQAIGFKNLVRISEDDADYYLDSSDSGNDFKQTMDRFIQERNSRYPEASRLISIALEKETPHFHYILEIVIQRTHTQKDHPLEVRIHGLTQEEEASGNHDRLFQRFILETEQNIKKYIPVEEIIIEHSPGNPEQKNRKVKEEAIRSDSPEKSSAKIKKTTHGTLFPLYDITLGKTDIEKLDTLGTRARDCDDDGEPYKYYVVNDMNFWFDNGVANSIYITYTDPIPDQWRELGFDWEKSYNEWREILEDLGCFLSLIKEPHTIKHYSGKHKCLEAEIMGTLKTRDMHLHITLNFNYSTETSVKAKNTLYNITIRAV